jgi:hypothetical protein
VSNFLGRFRTALKLDFSTLTSLSFTSNTTFTDSGGRTWTKINTASEITTTTGASTYVQPAVGSTVIVAVTSATGLAANDYVTIFGGTTAGGLYQITNVSGTNITVKYLATGGVANPGAPGATISGSQTFQRNAAFVNGTGLVLEPKSGTGDYTGTTRTLAGIWLPLGQIPLLADANWGDTIRVRAEISADNTTANFDYFLLGIDNNATTWTNWTKRGNCNVGGTNGIGMTLAAGVSPATTQGATFTLGNGNRVVELVTDLGKLHCRSAVGSNATIWPTPANMVTIATGAPGASAPANGLGTPNTTIGILLAAAAVNSGTILRYTIKNFQVDRLQTADES